jgi:adenine-specific DNA-methyltransferase
MDQARKQKLELTWIGKDEKRNLESRILIEDPDKSYGDTRTENMLIYGDNLLALKALEQDYLGKIKCIYIDPPFNTGQAFEQYDDGVEHSIWLNLMHERLVILRNLLSNDGSIWITLDENEVHYLKVVCDEIFGRNCFIDTVIWKTTDNSNNNVTQFSLDHNQILIYGKRPGWKPKFLNDEAKRTHFKNPDNDPRGPWFDGNPVNNPGLRPNLQFNITAPNGNVIKHPPNGWRWSLETIQEKMKTGDKEAIGSIHAASKHNRNHQSASTDQWRNAASPTITSLSAHLHQVVRIAPITQTTRTLFSQ